MPTRKESMMARPTVEMAMMLVVVGVEVGVVVEMDREETVTMYGVEGTEKVKWMVWKKMDIYIAMNEELSKAKEHRMDQLMLPATREVVE